MLKVNGQKLLRVRMLASMVNVNKRGSSCNAIGL